eukprot:4445251-Prymnesium_polylepis.1
MPPPKVTTRTLLTCRTHHESVISPPSPGTLRTIIVAEHAAGQILRLSLKGRALGQVPTRGSLRQ